MNQSNNWRTLAGLTASICEAIKGIAYAGKPGPFVFLFARPGNLPSVKVTVETHVVGEAQVFIEET